MTPGQQAGLYVHVPFCRRKCPYCSFFSVVPRPDEQRRYGEAVLRQLRLTADDPTWSRLEFASLFFGGGTPSHLPPDLLERIFAGCATFFPLDQAVEMSIEVNPGTIDGEGLQRLRRIGFNRISIGVQSFDDRELMALGRIHNREEALTTVRQARQAGFENLSIDLMYGLPGQSREGWRETLERALDLDLEHLSLYEMTLEEDTSFFSAVRSGLFSLPDEGEILAMMDITASSLSSGALKRYEISNYARAGKECRHNINYWRNGWYLGIGPGAVSACDGRRMTAVADLDTYCRRIDHGLPPWDDEERLDNAAAFRETVIMGLRMMAGVSVEELRQRYAIDLEIYYGRTLGRLLDEKMLHLAAGRLFLSRKGIPLANQVMAALV